VPLANTGECSLSGLSAEKALAMLKRKGAIGPSALLPYLVGPGPRGH
jgi:hypothetical protein